MVGHSVAFSLVSCNKSRLTHGFKIFNNITSNKQLNVIDISRNLTLKEIIKKLQLHLTFKEYKRYQIILLSIEIEIN